MKTNLIAKTPLIAALFVLASGASLAGSVGPLTTFNAGSTAVASEVNGNFTALNAAVNDNHARISVLETTTTGGNIVLAPSTATTGNIMKGGITFLHNFGANNSSTFLGLYAGNFTMTGTNNTATGYLSLASNTSGMDNTSMGLNSLRSNTTGNSNTASGVSALFGNTTGSNNTASGTFALEGNTTGSNNTASGYGALRSNTLGVSNTAVGVNALSNVATGTNNTAIGAGAGYNWTASNSNNIAIGNTGVAGELNTIRIGAPQTRAFIAGIRGVTTAAADAIPVVVDSNGQLGTVSSSRRVKDHIADMGEASSTLMKLRPVTFYYKTDRNPKGRALQYGLIAEEVEKVAPNLVARSANGEIETVFYQHLTPMLLNEYQKQQRLIETQTALLAKQTARIAALEKQSQEIVALKQELARMSAVLARLGQAEKVASAGR